MSVEEILTTIAKLPDEQRRQVYAALDEQRGLVWVPEYRAEQETNEWDNLTPQEETRLKALIQEGLESGPATPLDMDEIIREARAEWEAEQRA